MNSKRSYLDTLNAGRQRRPQTTLEQLNRSLETLEQRLGQTREEVTARPLRAIRRRPALSRATAASAIPPRPALSRRAANRPAALVRGSAAGTAPAEPGAGPFIRPELPGHRPRHRPRARPGRQRRHGRQDRRRTARHARGTAPPDDSRPAARIRCAAQGYRPRLPGERQPGASGKGSAELGVEFERLSGAIKSLSEKSDDRSVNLLRLELEQVKAALDTLAREESVQKVDRRWDDFDRRWSALSRTASTPTSASAPTTPAFRR